MLSDDEVELPALLSLDDPEIVREETVSLRPRPEPRRVDAWLQGNDVYREVGAEGVAAEGARIAFSSRLPVFHFVIAVDNRSGDGTFIAARNVPILP